MPQPIPTGRTPCYPYIILGTYITDKVEQGEKPDDKRRLSPAVSLSWRPFSESTLRIRASYKDIFRVPTFTDLYYLRMGNTNLKPEETSQYKRLRRRKEI